MKKITALLLLAVMLISLISCGDDYYEPVESTKEEKATVMTLTAGTYSYDVPYEMYRYLFLEHKSEVDQGDSTAWSGENKNDYISKIDKIILEELAEIYSAFAVCEAVGIDVFSSDVETEIKEYIKLLVDGDEDKEGVGDYETFLSLLSSNGMNYSVFTTLLRSDIATRMIDEYYVGSADSEDVDADMVIGELEYTEEDIRTFYYSDSDSVRLVRAAISYQLGKAEAERIKNVMQIAAYDGTEAVIQAIGNSAHYVSTSELDYGFFSGRYCDGYMYYDLMDAAFALQVGDVSEVVECEADGFYYIMYRLDKNDEHFANRYSEILTKYLYNVSGEKTHSAIEEMIKNVKYSGTMSSIDRSQIDF